MKSPAHYKSICFVISSLRAGGAERVVVSLANHFAEKEKFKVSIVTINKAEPFYIINSNIKIISLDILNNKSAFNNARTRVFKLSSALKSLKPSIIISFNATTSSEAIISAKLNRIPIIVSERQNPEISGYNKYFRTLRRITFPFANHLVCQTTDTMRWFKWVKNKSLIPNPVRFDEFKIKTKENVVLAVGSLHKSKGFDMLIKAFKLVAEDEISSDWKLIIVGEGEQRKELENYIESNGLKERILLPGKTESIQEYYLTSSIFVLSSRYEGLPNVLIEAQFFGLPCIAFDCDYGPREILQDGETGILVYPGDIKSLSHNIITLINDGGLRKDLGAKAQKASIRYSKDSIGDLWEKLIIKYSK